MVVQQKLLIVSKGVDKQHPPWMSQGIHINDLLKIQFYVSVNIHQYQSIQAWFLHRTAVHILHISQGRIGPFYSCTCGWDDNKDAQDYQHIWEQLFDSIMGHHVKCICYLVWF